MTIMIKICGITEPEQAYQIGNIGANYIGVIFAKRSKRKANMIQATEIAEQARLTGAEPVAVCTEMTTEELINICDKTDIHIIQCHDRMTRLVQRDLPANLRRIFVMHVDADGDITNQSDELIGFDPQRDFLLFDAVEGGSGQEIKMKKGYLRLDFLPSRGMTAEKYFIAGGLNPRNILTKIEEFKVIANKFPYGVDVSSGVEDRPGHKNLSLVQQLITNIREFEELHDVQNTTRT